MGKKYIIEIIGGEEGDMDFSTIEPYTEPDLEQVRKEAYDKGYENGFIAGHLKAEKSGQSFYEDGHQRGLNDAWEAARTLWNTPNRKEIFGHTTFNTVLTTLTAQEAIEKIRQYEQEKEGQIQVGDEVIRHYKNEFMEGDDAPSIFLSEEDGHFRCLAFNGRSIMIAEYPKNQYRKTGRHFHEIAEVLQKMKES